MLDNCLTTERCNQSFTWFHWMEIFHHLSIQGMGWGLLCHYFIKKGLGKNSIKFSENVSRGQMELFSDMLSSFLAGRAKALGFSRGSGRRSWESDLTRRLNTFYSNSGTKTLGRRMEILKLCGSYFDFENQTCIFFMVNVWFVHPRLWHLSKQIPISILL